jgi:hypothetical protein
MARKFRLTTRRTPLRRQRVTFTARSPNSSTGRRQTVTFLARKKRR